MPTVFYVDFTAGTNGSGSSAGSPFNSASAMRSAGAVGGDTFYCLGPLNGVLDLGTMAGTSLAKPISIVGVTNLSTLDRSSRTVVNASGQSAAFTGSGNNLLIENFEFKNSTSYTDQHSGSYITTNNCKFDKGTGSASYCSYVYERHYDGCYFSNYSSVAVTLGGSYGATVENCTFDSCGGGVSGRGYTNTVIRNNVFKTISSNALIMPSTAKSGTSFEICNNTFYGVGGSAMVFDGNDHSEVRVFRNLFVNVTGTGISVTNTPTTTVIGAYDNVFYGVGTNLGANVNDLGFNVTLGSNPLPSAPTDMSPSAGSGLRGTGYNGASFGGQQIGAGGSGGAPPFIRPARFYMERSLGETIILDFVTESSTGAAADADSTPTCEVFADSTDTPLLTPTVTKRTSKTGDYRVTLALTSGNGFAVGSSYNVLGYATIGGVAKKVPIASFIIRTGTVDSVNVSKVSGDATSATNLKNSLNGTGGVTFSANVSGSVASVAGNVSGSVASVVGNVGGNVVGSVGSVAGNVDGSVASVVGNVGGSVASVVGNVGGNVNGSVASVVGSVASVVGNVGGSVASVSGSVASVVGNVGGSVASVVGNVGGSVASVVGNVGGNVGGNVTGSVASVVGNVGGNVSGSVASVVGNVGGNVAGSVNSVVSGVQLSGTGLDNVFPESGINVKQLLSMLLATLAGEITGANTNSITIKNPDGSATRLEVTTDSSGNRSAIVLHLPA